MFKRSWLLTKHDVILISVILLIGFLLLGGRRGWARQPVNHAEITSQNSVHVVYLDHDRVFYLDGMSNVLFEVKNGRIAFVESDCADRICVNTGFIGHAGQMAACLPNGMIMQILGGDSSGNDDLDIFVR